MLKYPPKYAPAALPLHILVGISALMNKTSKHKWHIKAISASNDDRAILLGYTAGDL